MTISARQLANSFLARFADDVINVRLTGQEQVRRGFLGNDSRFREIAHNISQEALINARTLWEDLYGET